MAQNPFFRIFETGTVPQASSRRNIHRDLSISFEVVVNIKSELLEIPHSLQQMYEEGRPQYDGLVRRISWTERPVFMIGNGSSYPAALSGAHAFESILGMPVLVRRPAAFTAYTASALTRRSLVIVISQSEDHDETLLAARKAKDRGAIVWAITDDPASELARLADARVDFYSGESPGAGVRCAFCQHAVMLFLATAAARVLKGSSTQLTTQEEELGGLGRHVEWVLNQISDAGRALAGELRPLSRVFVAGAGAFHPIALQAASHLAKLAGVHARGIEILEFQQDYQQLWQPGDGVLYLSSSRCRLKTQVHESAREIRQKGDAKIFALTDSNNRQLSERAAMAILLPSLTESGQALLSLAFLDLVIHYASQTSSKSSHHRG